MNHTQLVEIVAAKNDGLAKTKADALVRSVLDTIVEGLKTDGEVTLLGIGKVKVAERAARTARNPKTGAAIQVPASKTARLSVGSALKEALN